MELNVKEQTEKLQTELDALGNQAAQIDNQIALLQQAKQDVVNQMFKKTGALELLQNLDGGKPKEEGK